MPTSKGSKGAFLGLRVGTEHRTKGKKYCNTLSEDTLETQGLDHSIKPRRKETRKAISVVIMQKGTDKAKCTV